MNTTLHHPIVVSHSNTIRKQSAWHMFMSWSESQEKNRFIWLALAIAGHGCVFTPLTLMSVMLAGNSMFLWAFAIAAMAMGLVVNLAALPTKITVPVFLLSLVIDVTIIISCLALIV